MSKTKCTYFPYKYGINWLQNSFLKIILRKTFCYLSFDDVSSIIKIFAKPQNFFHDDSL